MGNHYYCPVCDQHYSYCKCPPTKFVDKDLEYYYVNSDFEVVKGSKLTVMERFVLKDRKAKSLEKAKDLSQKLLIEAIKFHENKVVELRKKF